VVKELLIRTHSPSSTNAGVAGGGGVVAGGGGVGAVGLDADPQAPAAEPAASTATIKKADARGHDRCVEVFIHADTESVTGTRHQQKAGPGTCDGSAWRWSEP
jgi:hypothetical protein